MNEGKKDRRDTIRTIKPRNFVAKNAITSGAGAHKDKKKAVKQGETKHKNKEYAEGLQDRLAVALAENSQHSHQYDVTMKHAKNPTVQQRMAAHDIKPGTSGYRDRVDLLKDLERTGKLKKENSDAEYDDEAGMSYGSLHTIARAADGLLNTIKEGDNLPEWCQEKISLAEDYLVTVWDYLQSEQDVDEGWKSKLGGAALAGAMALGAGGAHADMKDVPAGGHNQLPDIVAHVTFKVGDKEITKDINLGSYYRSPGEASEELKNFMRSKGIKFYQYSLERVKPKETDYLDKTPASGDMKGGMDTTEPSAKGPSTDTYMAKDNDPERGPSMGGKFVKEGAKVDRQAKHITTSMMKKGKSKKDAEAIAWAHIKHPKKKAKEGWTHDSLADQLFEHERTYEEQLQNQLNKKLGR
jgi:hypothetical protein